MRDTNRIGDITEAKVLAALMSAGYTVSVPFGIAKYDLIMDTGTELIRVQCKTGRLRKGVVMFNVYSVRRGGGKITYQGEADLYGVYCPDTSRVYLVPVDDAMNTISLRVDPPKHPGGPPIRYAAEYEIHADVAQ
jgi:PD-(D/E)XK endonuclease